MDTIWATRLDVVLWTVGVGVAGYFFGLFVAKCPWIQNKKAKK